MVTSVSSAPRRWRFSLLALALLAAGASAAEHAAPEAKAASQATVGEAASADHKEAAHAAPRELARAEPKPAARAESKEPPRAEPKEAPRAEPKEAPRAEPKEAPRAEPKESARVQPKEAPRAEAKESAHAESREASHAEPKDSDRARSRDVARAEPGESRAASKEPAPASARNESARAKDRAEPAGKLADGARRASAKGGDEAAMPRPDPMQDPMDRLRERLAQKLGAIKPPGADNADVMRVVSKASSGSLLGGDIVTSGSIARPARRKAAPVVEHAAPMSGVSPGQAHWDYVGEGGPDAWAQLKPEFSKCANGSRQSPIDIRDGIKVDLDPIAFDYKAGSFRVVDNGHTVQVNVAPGSSIEVMGRRYDLVQFHFHRPSEERINGRQFDMVVHLVHRDLEGHLAVVAVLLDRGSALQAVQTVWNNLPLEKGDEVSAQTLLDPSDMLPTDRTYYTYMGSLTTPPCSEGVLWMVMKKPMPISADQVGVFARLYPMNARPIQSASGRLIKESN